MRSNVPGSVLLAASMLFCEPALAAETVPAPAQKAAGRAAEAKEQAGDEQYRTTVVGTPEKEADPVGEYGQPAWSTRRRFPTTRVYVLPKGGVNLDYWLVTEGGISGDSQPKYTSKLEFEFGLGARLQTDFFLRFEQDGYAGPMKLAAEELELRWALADWGKLPGNPALHFEYIRKHEGPPVLESKLLFGDMLSDRWFWGANLVFERELGGKAENEYALTAGLSRVVCENFFLAGIEVKAAAADEAGERFEFEEISLLAGPSFQLRPTRVLYVDFVPLAGVRVADNETTGHYAVYLVLGLELAE
ncbi:MAG: hypothetical protein HY897_12310 [Deltaproteobacteria bacterium]|nr:hypothetical protein [Deltaproteobacteria bacterium]